MKSLIISVCAIALVCVASMSFAVEPIPAPCAASTGATCPCVQHPVLHAIVAVPKAVVNKVGCIVEKARHNRECRCSTCCKACTPAACVPACAPVAPKACEPAKCDKCCKVKIRCRCKVRCEAPKACAAVVVTPVPQACAPADCGCAEKKHGRLHRCRCQS